MLATNDGPTALGSSTTLTATVLGDSSYNFDWALGNGTVLNAQPATIAYTYPAIGVYTATVTATKGAAAFTATTRVLVEEAITGLSAINDSPALVGTSTRLTATIGAGSNVVYHWDYGDLIESAIDHWPETAHSYQAGVFTATITAMNAVSLITATTLVEISTLVLLDDSPTYLGAGTTLTATLDTSEELTYTWDYGDGTAVFTNQISVTIHTYPAFGVYTATVSAITAALPS